MLRRSSSFGGSNRPHEAPDLVSGADRKNSPPNETISMQLGGNHLVLKDTGEWTIKSSDLDMATFEIEKLVDDKEKLTEALSAALEQIENLKSEIVEVNNMKSVVLEMLMNERQQRMHLEREISGYKDELKESFRVIVELRKLAPQLDEE